jgi:PRTRC genetic system protein A
MRMTKSNDKKSEFKKFTGQKGQLDLPISMPVKEEKPDPYKGMTETQKNETMLFMFNALNSFSHGKIEEDKLTSVNNYFIQGNGLYLIHKNKIGIFGRKAADFDVPGLPNQIPSPCFIKLYLPRMPFSIYQQIVTFFKAIMVKEDESEAFLQVYWDIDEQKYKIHVPAQVVSKGHVSYDATKNLNKLFPKKYIFVFECHSHNTMGAFWSSVDDADEKETRLYGVFGCLNTAEHQTKFRVMVNGKAINLEYNHIFDFDKESLATKEVVLGSGEIIPVKNSQIKDADVYHAEFNQDWIKAVTRRQVQTTSMISDEGHVIDEYKGYSRRPSYGNDLYYNVEKELEQARSKRDAALKGKDTGVIGMDDSPTEDELLEEFNLTEEASQLAQDILQITRYFADDELTNVVLSVIDDNGALKNLGRKIDRFVPEH